MITNFDFESMRMCSVGLDSKIEIKQVLFFFVAVFQKAINGEHIFFDFTQCQTSCNNQFGRKTVQMQNGVLFKHQVCKLSPKIN